MLPNYFYNNNYQFVQTKDALMILVEMVHDVRDHPHRQQPPASACAHRPWMGDSIGRWEGDTLVVETTNFHPMQDFRGASENLKVIERFSRSGPRYNPLQVRDRRPDHFYRKVGRGGSLQPDRRSNL